MSPDERQNPEMAATLAAIDATIAGEPVDAGEAEVAELVRLLAAERPTLAPEFAAELDRRVESRFGAAARQTPRASKRRSRGGWWWMLAPLGGLAAGIVALIVLAPIGGSGSSSSNAGFAVNSKPSTPRPALRFPPAHAKTLSPALSHSAAQARTTTAAAPGLQIPDNGRELIQSSQLSLGAPSSRIDTVAQEVFDVVGTQSGFVNSSTVTATGGTGGYAHFQLTVPSATLPQTMTQLSRLRYAAVLSRTDKVEDVTGQLRSAKRHHQKARVRALERGIAYSHVAVTIQADAPASATTHHTHGGGFTIGRAAHDALDVLTVVGGVLLIALAVIAPLGIVAAAFWWGVGAARQRRREHALDLA